MPRQVSEYWKGKVRTIYGECKGHVSPAPLAARLASEHQRNPHPDGGPPSIRWLGPYLSDLAAEMKANPHAFQKDELFSWPDSMGSVDLPWEASRCLLDLCREMPGEQVPIYFARWYWRASQAMPGAAIEERRRVAGQLALWEVVPAVREEAQAAALEDYLAYAPWPAGSVAETEYQQAIEEGRIAMAFLIALPATWPPGADIRTALDAVRGYHWEEGNQMMIDYINASPKSRSQAAQALIAELQRTAEEEGEEA